MKHRGFVWELGEEMSAWGWREEGESLTLFGSVFVGEGGRLQLEFSLFSKIEILHKIAIKIKGSFPIDFVGPKGGNGIVNIKSQPRSKDPTKK